MRRVLIPLGFAAVAILVAVAPAGADDMYETNADVILGEQYNVTHDEGVEGPTKGWAYFTVTNNGADDWGDFHFEITGDNTVVWADSDTIGCQDPITSISGAIYDISDDGKTIDWEFYDTPVSSGEMVTFNLYTNNPDGDSFFGVCYYPTPVPEPASMSVIALGGLLVVLRRRSD